MNQGRVNRRRIRAACSLAALLLVGAAGPAIGAEMVGRVERVESAEKAACPAPQRAVFACSTGAKQVSVCASPDLDTTAGTLQYRYGRPERLELALPEAGSDWRAATRAGTLMFSGGGGAHVAFERAPYRYTVYSAAGRGWAQSGVVVEKAGRRIASLRCKGGVVSELGPDLFARAGLQPPDVDFELP